MSNLHKIKKEGERRRAKEKYKKQRWIPETFRDNSYDINLENFKRFNIELTKEEIKLLM